MKMGAVITGDIVKSTGIDLKDRKILFTSILSLLEDLKKEYGLKYEFYRGDSFQIYSNQIEKILKIAILIRLRFMSLTPDTSSDFWDVRLSIGIGEISYNDESLKLSDGEAFHLSGRAFDKMKTSRLEIHTSCEEINEELNLSTSLVDQLILVKLNKMQALSLFYFFKNEELTQKMIAQTIMDVSPQKINSYLNNANFKLIEQYMSRFTHIICKVKGNLNKKQL